MRIRDFRLAEVTRKETGITKPLFSTNEDLETLSREAGEFATRYNDLIKKKGGEDSLYISQGKLHATAVLHMLYQNVLSSYLRDVNPDLFTRLTPLISSSVEMSNVINFYNKEFPSPLLERIHPDPLFKLEENIRGFFIHQVMLVNPALVQAAKPLVTPEGVIFPEEAKALQSLMGSYSKDVSRPGGGIDEDIFSFLTKPARIYPNSLKEQISYILREWSHLLSEDIKRMLLSSLDIMSEEEKDHGTGIGPGGPGPMEVPDYSGLNNEYEAFSQDTNWMPRVVMMAKCTLVWLDQLSKWYKRPITTLDQIPDAELDKLAEGGFTALWLIGLWERSEASKKIKILCGNPDAEASAYSLKDYEISEAIGGWKALENLRERCSLRGIRLASDMVPNHTGLDSTWMYEHPEYFISQDYSPFPSYTYNGPDLSDNPNIEIKIEDHYYNRSDAAVTFRRIDKRSGETKYVFHGNDGTTMPWNDTAQLDYLNPITREAVIEKIIHVAQNFPIIRFDAAMTLAKRHIQRLWYPKPGDGGDIAGRYLHALSDEEFNRRIPQEFWREVVDRIAKEVPDTLLLAEAFWMMEGYFVRTLGMHRVYNSAFMNMLKNQENQKYRLAIKNTLVFEPEILKRYVNFMNNPDEETAIAQFGDGNRYFSICTILSTLPGLPMFGHGQIEGFHEKYGMEYKRAYWDEKPNEYLINEHKKRIFPLLRKRYLFSGVEHFNLYDAYHNGNVEESIFAYVNGAGAERTLVIVNNQYERVEANIKLSTPKLKKSGDEKSTISISLADNLGLTFGGRRYVIYDNFTTGLTYLAPSIKFFEEGFNFKIEGYDSLVLWNIREVEDVDGSYEKLCAFLGGNGISNIAVAIALLRLEPVYKVLDAFRSQAFFRGLEALVYGKSTVQSERSLLLTIAETYTHLTAIADTLDDACISTLPRKPEEVDPALMVREIRSIGHLFSTKCKTQAFVNYAQLAPEVPLMLAAAIVLKPFIEEGKATELEALTAADSLLLTHFFEQKKEEMNLSEEEMHRIMHNAALITVMGHTLKPCLGMTPIEILRFLLANKSVRDEVKCNEYNGVTWYNKELMQSLIVLSALSIMIINPNSRKFDGEEYISTLLEKEATSEYKLDKLLL